MDVYPERAFEDAVLALDLHLLYIGVELLVDDCGNFMQYAHAVDTFYLDGYGKVELLVGFPLRGEYPVAVTALEGVCMWAVTLVDDDVLVVIVVSQHVVSRYGVTAVCNDVAALDVLVGEVDGLLAVDVFVCLYLTGLFLLVAVEREE